MKPMRGGAILVLLGLTAFGAYSVGRQSAPVSNAPIPAITSPSTLAQPVAFIDPAAQPPAPVPAPSTKAGLPNKPAAPETKRKVETALTAAGHRRDHRPSEPGSISRHWQALRLPG
jgi:hypothetical protein